MPLPSWALVKPILLLVIVAVTIVNVWRTGAFDGMGWYQIIFAAITYLATVAVALRLIEISPLFGGSHYKGMPVRTSAGEEQVADFLIVGASRLLVLGAFIGSFFGP